MNGDRLLQFCVVAGLIVAGGYALPHFISLPASLAGLRQYGPAFTFFVAAAMALAFRRGRVVAAVATLALAYAALRLTAGAPASQAAMAVHGTVFVLVPLNLAALAWLAERGTFSAHGLRRLAVIVLESAVVAWLAMSGKPETIAWLHERAFDLPVSLATPVSQAGLIAIVAGAAIALAGWWVQRSAIDIALAGAIVAFGLAAHGRADPSHVAALMSTAAAILAVGVLQDTFRMAFRDELTGLPSRRALEECLAGLSGRYTIAMTDVDHFKKFNDTHGHDVGDQVLKLVAAQLANVRGGGRAFRYGGEEFAVVFPRLGAERALPHLESLRAAVENHQLVLRAEGRPAQEKSGRKQRGRASGRQAVSVTISIGVAEHGDRHATPADVMQAADKALYRAKRAGRNRVSR